MVVNTKAAKLYGARVLCEWHTGYLLRTMSKEWDRIDLMVWMRW
jgi:hypothetical protein